MDTDTEYTHADPGTGTFTEKGTGKKSPRQILPVGDFAQNYNSQKSTDKKPPVFKEPKCVIPVHDPNHDEGFASLQMKYS